MKPIRTGRIALVAGALALLAVGCKKEEDSLILVSITADAQASAVTSLTLSTEGTSQVFKVPSGLSPTAQIFGLYVPSSVTGIVKIAAVASSGTCSGYKGQGTATIPKAGTTSDPPTSIKLMRADVCAADGGATGTGGATSTGGGTGTGGATATGGATGTGGATATGGATGTGGATSTGGGTGTGGATSTGGGGGTGCSAIPPAGTPPALTCCQEYEHESDCANDAGVWGVAFSPDGTWMVTGGDDGRYQLWSFDGHTLTASTQVWTAPGGIGYGYVAFSADGKYLALAGYLGVAIYDVGTWTAEKTLTIGDVAYGVGFAPDSQHVLSIDAATIYVHALGTASALTSASYASSSNGLAVARTAISGGVAVAAGGDTGGAVFTYAPPSTLSGPATLTFSSADVYDQAPTAAISPDGASLAFGDIDATVWFSSFPTTSHTIASASSFVVDPTNYESVEALAYGRDGGSIAVVAAGYPGAVSIWSVATKAVSAEYLQPSYPPISVVFSPAGNAIVVGEYDCGKFLLCTN